MFTPVRPSAAVAAVLPLIQAARLNLGLYEDDMAQQYGFGSTEHYALWEQGHRPLDVEEPTVQLMCRHLSIPWPSTQSLPPTWVGIGESDGDEFDPWMD